MDGADRVIGSAFVGKGVGGGGISCGLTGAGGALTGMGAGGGVGASVGTESDAPTEVSEEEDLPVIASISSMDKALPLD